MHHMLRAADVGLVPDQVGQASQYWRCRLVDRSIGSVHTGFGLCEMASGGRQNLHVHSHEEGFYLIEGNPTLVFEQGGYSLSPGACGLIPLGTPHAWIGPEQGRARWLDMLAPQPSADGEHTHFIGPVDNYTRRQFDIRNPTNRHFFYVTDDDVRIDALRTASSTIQPAVSASMATALLAFRGVTIKMLVDQRLDAASLTMFMVEYQPGGKIDPHDHPFEETYYLLEGEVDAVADGVPYSLKPGDLFWTGVGSVHAFYNNSDRTVRWLETQSPQPPIRNGFRFARDWEYLKQKLINA